MHCSACGAANPPGMRYCGMCGRAFAVTAGDRERRRVSVVFVDLMGFSGLTQGLDPEELRDLADQVLTAVAGVIESYDGYVDAFRGDGAIAVFGAPYSHPDDPYRAVVAAEAGLQAIERVGRGRGADLRGRAGVGTGVVIAGAVGSGRVREYTVMGSTVNLASRLEHAAGPGEVWVCPETYRATRHRLTYEPIDGVTLPGFPNVTTANRLVSRMRREADPNANLAFVGRERELAQLMAWRRSVGRLGHARLVWLLGEAGSGKTRLLREFAARVGNPAPAAGEGYVAAARAAGDAGAGRGGEAQAAGTDAGAVAPGGLLDRPGTKVVWLCSDPQMGFSWGSVAQQLFGIPEGEDDRTQGEMVRRALRELLPEEPGWQRLVLSTLALAPSPTWNRLERRAVDRRLLAWCDVFAALARRHQDGELVVLVECDGVDPTLEAFLERLSEVDAPVLVVRASRRRDAPKGSEAVALEPLSVDESMALFGQVADPVFERAGRALISQVGGVPASVFELGRALSITQDTHFRGSLTSLLQARLDLLEPRARRLLALAAICGERVWEGMLRSSLGDVRADLRFLRRCDALVRQPSSSLAGEVEYRFRSELLRHAVLEMIPFADRPALHLRLATWLEERAPLAFSELIAEHFERAGATDAAYAHYLTAADEAEAARDRVRANRLYHHLVGLDVGPALRAQGALAYAQAAIVRGERDLARLQLDLARAALAPCDLEDCARLRETEARLRADLEASKLPPGEEPATPVGGGWARAL